MPKSDNLAIALQFIDGCRDADYAKARAVMHDDMVHASPSDHTQGADTFIDYYRENFGGNGWRYELLGSVETSDEIAVRYRSIIPDVFDVEMVEWFTVRAGKIVRADNYLASFVGPS